MTLHKFKFPGVSAVLLALALLLFLPLFSLVETAGAAPDCLKDTPTGYQACGPFFEYWNRNGGLDYFGWPISEVLTERNSVPPAGDGQEHKVQYFERARMELHPEMPAPFYLLLGLLGSEQLVSLTHTGPRAVVPGDPADCLILEGFSEKACGAFARYYRQNGGLLKFGGPISPVFYEKNQPKPSGDDQTHIVQYFERVRMEFHPENQPPYDILLGLLGSEQYRNKYGRPLYYPPPVGFNPQPEPAPVVIEPFVQFVEVKGGLPGGFASVTVQTSPKAYCTITYVTPEGTRGTVAGTALDPQYATDRGVVNWYWRTLNNSSTGNGSVTVNCSGASASISIYIF